MCNHSSLCFNEQLLDTVEPPSPPTSERTVSQAVDCAERPHFASGAAAAGGGHGSRSVHARPRTMIDSGVEAK